MKNISLALIAILAIAMTSCNTDPVGGSAISSSSKNWQTPTSEMVFEGVVKTPIIDHEMVATDLIIGGIPSEKGYDSIYAYVADSDYKMAVAMNDAIVRGYKLRVHMVENWYWFRFRMRIIDYSVITNTVQKTKPDNESRETFKPKKRIRKYVPAPMPVVAPTQPCCCETININGNINITVVTQEEKQKPCMQIPEKGKVSSEEDHFPTEELFPKPKSVTPRLKKKEPMTYPWN